MTCKVLPRIRPTTEQFAECANLFCLEVGQPKGIGAVGFAAEENCNQASIQREREKLKSKHLPLLFNFNHLQGIPQERRKDTTFESRHQAEPPVSPQPKAAPSTEPAETA